jgi:hypothetical protein
MRFSLVMALSLVPIACAAAAGNPQLQEIHSVYFLPMGNSLDQYLAQRLIATGMFQVVTDPQKADAVFSDKIGEGLEDRLNELYPPPKEKKVKDDSTAEKDPYGQPIQRFGSFSRGHGTIFLVDRRTRNVVWSIYWPIKSSRPDDTNKRAGEIARKLQKDVTGKP